MEIFSVLTYMLLVIFYTVIKCKLNDIEDKIDRLSKKEWQLCTRNARSAVVSHSIRLVRKNSHSLKLLLMDISAVAAVTAVHLEYVYTILKMTTVMLPKKMHGNSGTEGVNEMEDHVITIRIYWQDLSENMQQRLLKVFGDNCNWDVIPMTEIIIENDKDITFLSSVFFILFVDELFFWK